MSKLGLRAICTDVVSDSRVMPRMTIFAFDNLMSQNFEQRQEATVWSMQLFCLVSTLVPYQSACFDEPIMGSCEIDGISHGGHTGLQDDVVDVLSHPRGESRMLFEVCEKGQRLCCYCIQLRFSLCWIWSSGLLLCTRNFVVILLSYTSSSIGVAPASEFT